MSAKVENLSDAEPCGNGSLTDCDEYKARVYRRDLHKLYEVVVPLLLTFCFCSFLMNAYIIVLSRWLRRPLTPVLKLSLSLAVADAWTSLIIMIGLLLNSYIPHVLFIALPHQNCLVLIIEAFRLGGILTSELHLMLLAVSHLLAIVYPNTQAKMLRGRVLCVVIAACWCLPADVYLSWFVAMSQTIGGGSYDCLPNFMHNLNFRILIVCIFLVPLLVTAVLYPAMVVRVLQIGKQFGRLQRRTGRSLHKKRRAVITMLFMISSFVAGWLPTSIVYILTAESLFIYYSWNPKLLFSLSVTANFFMFLKFHCNPLIYALRIPEYREVVWRPCGIKAPSSRRIESSLSHEATNNFLRRSHSRNSSASPKFASFKHKNAAAVKQPLLTDQQILKNTLTIQQDIQISNTEHSTL